MPVIRYEASNSVRIPAMTAEAMFTASRALGIRSVSKRIFFCTFPPRLTRPMVTASISGLTANAAIDALGWTSGLGLPTCPSPAGAVS